MPWLDLSPGLASWCPVDAAPNVSKPEPGEAVKPCWLMNDDDSTAQSRELTINVSNTNVWFLTIQHGDIQ